LPDTRGIAQSAKAVAPADAFFVLNARKFTSDGDAVTLLGFAPVTLYFADRPRREVGHLGTRDFLALWDRGEHGFEAHPPVALLAFLDPLLGPEEAPPDDVAVVLRDPYVRGDALTYTVELLAGTLPAETGSCSLFIDARTRPPALRSVADLRGADHPVRTRRTETGRIRVGP
jgi:hypothetical protein